MNSLDAGGKGTSTLVSAQQIRRPFRRTRSPQTTPRVCPASLTSSEEWIPNDAACVTRLGACLGLRLGRVQRTLSCVLLTTTNLRWVRLVVDRATLGWRRRAVLGPCGLLISRGVSSALLAALIELYALTLGVRRGSPLGARLRAVLGPGALPGGGYVTCLGAGLRKLRTGTDSIIFWRVIGTGRGRTILSARSGPGGRHVPRLCAVLYKRLPSTDLRRPRRETCTRRRWAVTRPRCVP